MVTSRRGHRLAGPEALRPSACGPCPWALICAWPVSFYQVDERCGPRSCLRFDQGFRRTLSSANLPSTTHHLSSSKSTVPNALRISPRRRAAWGGAQAPGAHRPDLQHRQRCDWSTMDMELADAVACPPDTRCRKNITTLRNRVARFRSRSSSAGIIASTCSCLGAELRQVKDILGRSRHLSFASRIRRTA